jgi:hypothetical protein
MDLNPLTLPQSLEPLNTIYEELDLSDRIKSLKGKQIKIKKLVKKDDGTYSLRSSTIIGDDEENRMKDSQISDFGDHHQDLPKNENFIPAMQESMNFNKQKDSSLVEPTTARPPLTDCYSPNGRISHSNSIDHHKSPSYKFREYTPSYSMRETHLDAAKKDLPDQMYSYKKFRLAKN